MSTNVASAAGFASPASFAFLRRALLVDAIVCAGCAVLALLAADWLSPYLGLSPTFLRGAGIVLIPFVALVLVTANRRPVSQPLVVAVILFNIAWVLASLGVLVTGAVAPTGLGVAFILAQAAAVAVLGWLESVGLRRSLGAAVA